MGFEDLKCPYCGTPNPFAEKHQKEMRRFETEFVQARDEVVTASRKRAGRNAALILLLVLVLLDAGAFFFVSVSSDIGYEIRRKEVEAGAGRHLETLLSFLEEGDYCGFAEYYSTNGLYHVSDENVLNEYEAVERAAGYYEWVVRDLERYIGGNSYRFRGDSLDSTCSYMAEYLTRLWNVEEDFSYQKETLLAPDKMAYIEDMRNRVSLLLQAYAGLTEEEAAGLGDMSESRILKILKERLVSVSEE